MASLSRVKGYKEETIRNWLQQAAEHATQVEDVLMGKYEIERGQLDALWSYVGHKEQEAEEGKKKVLTTNPKSLTISPPTTTRKEFTGARR